MERQKINYCSECHVFVDPGLAHCPLCKKQLTQTPEENGLYPDVSEQHYVDRHTFWGELLVFLTFLFIGGSIVINLAVWNGIPWFLAVAAPLLYVWVMVRITLFSDMYAGTKALFQILGVMGMMLAYDFVSGWHGWSCEYILPLVLVAGIVYIDVYSYIYKSYWRDNLVYAIVFVAIGFLPFIFYFTGVTHAVVPMVLSTVASGLTVLGILRFTVNYFKTEMKKRFHI